MSHQDLAWAGALPVFGIRKAITGRRFAVLLKHPSLPSQFFDICLPDMQ
jgi:hypothetical protein